MPFNLVSKQIYGCTEMGIRMNGVHMINYRTMMDVYFNFFICMA